MFTRYYRIALSSASSLAGARQAQSLMLNPASTQASARGGKRVGKRLFLNAVIGTLIAATSLSAMAPCPAQSRVLPDKLEFDARPIVFRHGVPVGGWAHVTLYQNGRYHFTGHFHDSGAPSYNVSLAWIVRSPAGQALLFSQKGHLHGTFESGSRNCDWDTSGANDDIRRSWTDFAAGSQATCKSNVNIDIGATIAEVKKAAETAGQIVKLVQVVFP